MAKTKNKGDVYWMVPNRKRPIAYSTIATKELIHILSQDYATIRDVYYAINYDEEAKNVLAAYIKLGLGNEIAKEWF